uniref:S46 family peptidase n=1 Tax=Ningiella ruwaisensis TaxID=2364274 RepID=UPI00109FDA31|nr:S46 family peptidase [Ningiella ruwaisensis]
MQKIRTFTLAMALIASASSAIAKEGMFTPEQLPLIKNDLAKTGLKISPDSLSNLTDFPMGAVVSLGGCSASFVSPKGLVVTNHHCARGSVQFNSTAENNYLEDGFLAKTLEEELPAAPGSRIYVTEAFSDVTEQVLGDIPASLVGKARFDAITDKRKAIVSECEKEAGYRCSVSAFFEGKEYKLIKQLEIRDVRIAYAPADSIGKYGGDIDNWMWPRHTGDFAFYRAYVGPDGKPADYSEDNKPYRPEHFLKVSAKGVDAGDFVMVAGYPGSTNRYALLSRVEHVFNWLYPTYIDLISEWIAVIEQAAPEGSDARVKYESSLAGLNNFLKNTKGQLEGAKRVGLVERRKAREAALNEWLSKSESRTATAQSIEQLNTLAKESAQADKQEFWYDFATRPQLLGVAQRLYRLAIEREKPDAAREIGYQQRDMTRFEESLKRIDRRYDPQVDRALWAMYLSRYLQEPEANRVEVLDKALNLDETQALGPQLNRFYEGTSLNDVETRLALMQASKEELEKSDDPFMQLAVALFDESIQRENEAKERAGLLAALQPDYMSAIIDWQKENGQVVYPDANSTLRVTYGNVMGGSPKDGLIYEPFTRLEGITEKDTGTAPFNSPGKQLELIETEKYGPYKLESIDSVPVNFLSDLDVTGGNSGSATLNAQAELVGLLFDGTFESVNSDWDFDPKTTRSIHVDSRYMLWVMEYVDGANNLIDEMSISQ